LEIKTNKKMLKINEIFYSLQGEGTRAGKLCVFIRLAGCNLKCRWCDTKYAIDSKNSIELSINEIIKEVKKYDCNFVEITGGEPLFQPECVELTDRLLELNYEVAIETNGSLSIEKLQKEVAKIIDFKCPDSDMENYNLYENINYLTLKDEVKFVIASKNDFDWSIDVIKKYKLYNKVNNILFSAVASEICYNDVAELILSIENEDIKKVVRMQLQFHKIIWNDARGK